MSKLSGFNLENFLSITIYLEKIEYKKLIVTIFNEIIFSSSELDEAKDKLKKLINIPGKEILNVINSLTQTELRDFIAAVYNDKEIVKKFYEELSKSYIKILEEDVAYKLSSGMLRKEKVNIILKMIDKLKDISINKEMISDNFLVKPILIEEKYIEEFKNIIYVNVEKLEFNKYLLKIRNIDIIFDREGLEKVGILSFVKYMEDKKIDELAKILVLLLNNFETREIISILNKNNNIDKVEFYKFALLFLNSSLIKALVEEMDEFDKKIFSKEYKIFKENKENIRIKEGFINIFKEFMFASLEVDNKTLIIKKLKDLIQ